MVSFYRFGDSESDVAESRNGFNESYDRRNNTTKVPGQWMDGIISLTVNSVACPALIGRFCSFSSKVRIMMLFCVLRGTWTLTATNIHALVGLDSRKLLLSSGRLVLVLHASDSGGKVSSNLATVLYVAQCFTHSINLNPNLSLHWQPPLWTNQACQSAAGHPETADDQLL